MAMQRAILEMGAGTSLHGKDYTKAAVRAVDEALHHASLTFLKSLDIDPATMHVTVTIGVQEPGAVDKSAVAAKLPHGQVEVRVVRGGLDVLGVGEGEKTVIASAALEARINI